MFLRKNCLSGFRLVSFPTCLALCAPVTYVLLFGKICTAPCLGEAVVAKVTIIIPITLILIYNDRHLLFCAHTAITNSTFSEGTRHFTSRLFISENFNASTRIGLVVCVHIGLGFRLEIRIGQNSVVG